MTGKILLIVMILLPILCGIIGWWIGRSAKKGRDLFNCIATFFELIIVIWLGRILLIDGDIYLSVPDIMGEGLFLKLDAFRYIFVFLTSLIWFLVTVFSTQYLIRYKNRNRYYFFYMMTLSATLGIFVSADLLNLFTFFEIMSFTSYILVIHDEDKYAHEAGNTYIAMAVIGGLVLLMGLFLLYNYTGTLYIELLYDKLYTMGEIKYLVVALIIIGFAVKAGMFPLHIWLPKAYAAAPSPASAILSSVLSKTGVFGIIIVSGIMMRGDFFVSITIFTFGLLTMFVGGFMALMQKNLKRTFAYSSMSQIGYMLLGTGLIGLLGDHNAIAIYATIYHLVNHSVIKILLFLCAGIIYMTLHDMNINRIKGFGVNKPILKLGVFIGLLGISGMPGFAGFISKSLLHEAMAKVHHLYHNQFFSFAEFIFTISSGLTVSYMLKIFVAVFIETNDKFIIENKNYMTRLAALPIIISASLVIILGNNTELLFYWIEGSMKLFHSHGHIDGAFFTMTNLKGALLPIAIGLLIYAVVVRKMLLRWEEGKMSYINPLPDWFDLEKSFYLPICIAIYETGIFLSAIADVAIVKIIGAIVFAFRRFGDIPIFVPSFNMEQWLEKYEGKHSIENISKNESKVRLKNLIDSKMNLIIIEKEKLSTVFGGVRNRLNSIMYGIFIFAIALVIILSIMLFKTI